MSSMSAEEIEVLQAQSSEVKDVLVEQEEKIARLLPEDEKVEIKVTVKNEKVEVVNEKQSLSLETTESVDEISAENQNVESISENSGEVKTNVKEIPLAMNEQKDVHVLAGAEKEIAVSQVPNDASAQSRLVTPVIHEYKTLATTQTENSFKDIYNKGLTREVAEQIKVNITQSAIKGIESKIGRASCRERV